MADNKDKINQLSDKLESLLKRQDDFVREINNLKFEINKLKTTDASQEVDKKEIKDHEKVIHIEPNPKIDSVSIDQKKKTKQVREKSEKKQVSLIDKTPKRKSDLEKFIGENLISKIGIIIIVIGVAIGAKYSIENDLISPLTRVILGYLTGLGLLGFGIKLKKKYKNYSAVLVSGAIAILYFITYSAYSFYELIPQIAAFGLMVVFTAFTVRR